MGGGLFLLGAVALASLYLGAVRLDDPAFASQAPYIFWHIRLPRLVGAVLTGAALAVAGVLMQGLFRNPLAGPEVLGVSGGASLAAVLVVVVAPALAWAMPLAAAAGAVLSALLIYLVARRGSGTMLLRVVLVGLASGAVLNSLISVILLFADQYQLSTFIFWTMGGLQGRGWKEILWPLPLLLSAMILAMLTGRSLNLFALGEEQAHASGIGVEAAKRRILAIAAMLVAMAIAIAGPVGFIGLLVPHACRLLCGADHRRILPLALVLGPLVLASADLIGRTIVIPHEIQAGIVTALLGSPLFLLLILRRPSRGQA